MHIRSIMKLSVKALANIICYIIKIIHLNIAFSRINVTKNLKTWIYQKGEIELFDNCRPIGI